MCMSDDGGAISFKFVWSSPIMDTSLDVIVLYSYMHLNVCKFSVHSNDKRGIGIANSRG